MACQFVNVVHFRPTNRDALRIFLFPIKKLIVSCHWIQSYTFVDLIMMVHFWLPSPKMVQCEYLMHLKALTNELKDLNFVISTGPFWMWTLVPADVSLHIPLGKMHVSDNCFIVFSKALFFILCMIWHFILFKSWSLILICRPLS